MDLLALALPVVLLALVGWPDRVAGDKPRIAAAHSQIQNFMTALDAYKLDTGTFPSTGQGLLALRVKPAGVNQWNGPYMPQDIPADPWGHDYVYRYPGEHGDKPDVVSLGPGVPQRQVAADERR